MKRAFLLIIVPAVLVAVGFTQTPAENSNTDQTIKGCLAGSDGNYTVVEDNTGHVLKITTSSVDFKQHLGHNVSLIGRRTSGASSAPADNSFAVTELNMVSEHCAAAAAAAPTATAGTPAETTVPPAAAAAVPVAPTSSTVAETAIKPAAATPTATAGTPAETVVPPAAAPAVPVAPTSSTVAEAAIKPAADAASPAASATTPATLSTPATAVTPDAAATPPSETVVTPAADAASPAAAVITPQEKPPADATAPARRPARSRRLSEASAAVATTPDVTATTPSESASAPAPAASPVPSASTPSATAGTPDATATTPPAPARRGALWLLIALAVLVIVIGTLVPFLNRWRKRRSLEQTGAPNLSFTREASSDQGKSGESGPRKAA